MAKQIKSSDIFEKEDIFQGIRDSAKRTLADLDKVNKQLNTTADTIKNKLNNAKFGNISAINEFIKLTEKANKTQTEAVRVAELKVQTERNLQIAERELIKTEAEKERLAQQQIKTQSMLSKEEERKARAQQKATQTAQNEANAYKRLEANTRELKNESKRLGAELLLLEQNGKKNTAEFQRLEAQYRKVTSSAQQGDQQLKKLDKTVGDNFRNVGNYQKAMGGLNSVLGGLGVTLGVGYAVGQIKSLVTESIELARVQEKAVAQVAVGLESTGNKVGYTLDELKNKASEFQKQTLFDDDAILQDVTGILLTFTSIQGDVFDRTQQAVLDLSTKMGSDLKSASIQLGKALNDPIKGITALKRVGVSFTESQKDQIAVLVESGKLMEAQTLILDEMAVEFGGAAQGAARADGGFTQLNNAIGDAKELFGALLIERLRPMTKGLLEFFSSLTRKDIEKFMNTLSILGRTIMTIVRVWAVYNAGAQVTILYNKLMGSSFVTMSKSMGVARASLNALKLGFESLKTAFASNPFGIIMVALTELYANWDLITGLFDGTKKDVEELTEEQIAYKESIKGTVEYSKAQAKYVADETAEFQGLIEQLRQTNYGTKERSTLLSEINKKYDINLKNIANEGKFQEQLNSTVAEYIALKETEFALKKNAQRVEDINEKKYKEQLKVRKFENELERVKIRQQQESKYTDFLGAGKTAEEIKTLESQIDSVNGVIDRYNNQLKGLVYNENDLKDRMNELTRNGRDWNVTLEKSDGLLEDEGEELDENGEKKSKNAKATKEINTEFKKSNEYLSKQVELLNQLNDVENKRRINDLADQIADETELQQKSVDTTGEYDLKKFTELVEEKYQLEVNRILDQATFEQEQNDIKYQREKIARQKALEDEYKDLIKGAGDSAEAKAKIEANYLVAKQKLSDDEALIYTDLVEQNKLVTKEATDDAIELEKSKLDLITDTEKQMFEAKVEFGKKGVENQKETTDKELEDLKKAEEEKRAVVKATADFFQKRSQDRVAQIETEMEKAKEQYTQLEELAKQGNITAQQSLAEQQRIITEANLKKEREQKRQQRIALAESIYSTYSQKVEAGSKSPLADTIRDVSLLTQFVNTLPTFEEGTEDTGKNGRGIDGKGGFHAILHPNERVIPKSLNQRLGNLTNEELTKIAQEYQVGKAMTNRDTAHSSMDLAILVNEIKDLKQVIKNKPEVDFQIGEITSSMLEFVKKTSQGNTTTFNRYKVRK